MHYVLYYTRNENRGACTMECVQLTLQSAVINIPSVAEMREFKGPVYEERLRVFSLER